MDTQNLRAFLLVAETGSFSQATAKSWGALPWIDLPRGDVF